MPRPREGLCRDGREDMEPPGLGEELKLPGPPPSPVCKLSCRIRALSSSFDISRFCQLTTLENFQPSTVLRECYMSHCLRLRFVN